MGSTLQKRGSAFPCFVTPTECCLIWLSTITPRHPSANGSLSRKDESASSPIDSYMLEKRVAVVYGTQECHKKLYCLPTMVGSICLPSSSTSTDPSFILLLLNPDVHWMAWYLSPSRLSSELHVLFKERTTICFSFRDHLPDRAFDSSML